MIQQNRVSQKIGYSLAAGEQPQTGRNLNASVIVIGQANDAQISGLATTKQRLRKAIDVARVYGFGSPLHRMASQLLPPDGSGSGIPIDFLHVPAISGGATRVDSITITGTVTKNVTGRLAIAGESQFNGFDISFSVLTTDTTTTLASKIVDSINNVQGSPVVATSTAGVVSLTSKFSGKYANELNYELIGLADTGLTFSIANTTAGAGDTSIVGLTTALGNDWTPLVLCQFNDKQAELAAVNGKPDPVAPTGRYGNGRFIPFIAYVGSKESTLSSVEMLVGTSNKEDLTVEFCSAPNSNSFTWTIAAEWMRLRANIMQNRPTLDIAGQSLSGIHVASTAGEFGDDNTIDLVAKTGHSTAQIINDKYEIVDSVTTYRPDGEIAPVFRFTRDIVVDLNIGYRKKIIDKALIINKVIVDENSPATSDDVIKPSQVKVATLSMAQGLAEDGFIADLPYFAENLVVVINSANASRIDTSIKYRRTSTGKIADTLAEANFYFGN